MILAFLLIGSLVFASEGGDPGLKAAQFFLELDQMRTKNAQTLTSVNPSEVVEGTFAAVCKPVGARMKSKASETGWTLQQVTDRPRNPAAKISPEELSLLKQFKDDVLLQTVVRRASESEPRGTWVFSRITVQESCLKCHGDASHRPAFIVQKYPQDLAFGFKVGDLRGLYRAFLPEVKK